MQVLLQRLIENDPKSTREVIFFVLCYFIITPREFVCCVRTVNIVPALMKGGWRDATWSTGIKLLFFHCNPSNRFLLFVKKYCLDLSVVH